MIGTSTFNIFLQATPQDAAKILPLLFVEDSIDTVLENLLTALASTLNAPSRAIFVAWHRVNAIGVAMTCNLKIKIPSSQHRTW